MYDNILDNIALNKDQFRMQFEKEGIKQELRIWIKNKKLGGKTWNFDQMITLALFSRKFHSKRKISKNKQINKNKAKYIEKTKVCSFWVWFLGSLSKWDESAISMWRCHKNGFGTHRL